MTNAERCTFIADEQAMQLAYFARHFSRLTGNRDRPFQLKHEHRFDGLLPAARDAAKQVFARTACNIQFHPFIGHTRSSQACCLNFLMPLASRPALLARWIGTLLDIAPPTPLTIEETAAGAHRHVAFEYTGPGGKDFLDEAGGARPGRGAHATAADAAVGFIDADGRRQLLLIEWKYSEQYRGHRLSPDRNDTRLARYADKAFAPDGPIRADLALVLADFFDEPFYQLLRQQMLAWQIERRGLFDRVRVLHLSPLGNRALHAVTAPALRVVGGVDHDDAFDAYRATLVDPDAFLSRSIKQAFAPLATWPEVDWFSALAERYPSLCSDNKNGKGPSRE